MPGTLTSSVNLSTAPSPWARRSGPGRRSGQVIRRSGQVVQRSGPGLRSGQVIRRSGQVVQRSGQGPASRPARPARLGRRAGRAASPGRGAPARGPARGKTGRGLCHGIRWGPVPRSARGRRDAGCATGSGGVPFRVPLGGDGTRVVPRDSVGSRSAFRSGRRDAGCATGLGGVPFRASARGEEAAARASGTADYRRWRVAWATMCAAWLSHCA